MKNWVVLFAIVSFCSLVRADQSGPGNGTDYVKVLFAEAQYELLRLSAVVEEKDLQTLSLDDESRTWLSAALNGSSRYSLVKRYLRLMELRFQEEPCSDFTKKPASICFFHDPQQGPYVVVSLEENKHTSQDQAMAMLIHEAGHFTGEKDHLLLDRVGVRLAQALKEPRLLVAELQSREISAQPFADRELCNSGKSPQALSLRKQLEMELTEQCAARRLTCDLTKVQVLFQSEEGFVPGVGFDMSVVCRAKAILPLR